jgi:hypothetical protein
VVVGSRVGEPKAGTRKLSVVNKGVLYIMHKLKKTLALAGVLTMLAPAAAMAQDSTDAYTGPSGAVKGLEEASGNQPSNDTAPVADQSPAKDNAPVAAKSENQLPFTGADLGVVAAAGALLVGFGVGLRRLTHGPAQA